MTRTTILLQPIVFTGINSGVIQPDDLTYIDKSHPILGDRPREFSLILNSQCQAFSLQKLKSNPYYWKIQVTIAYFIGE